MAFDPERSFHPLLFSTKGKSKGRRSVLSHFAKHIVAFKSLLKMLPTVRAPGLTCSVPRRLIIYIFLKYLTRAFGIEHSLSLPLV